MNVDFPPQWGPATDIFGDNYSPWKAPAKNRLKPDPERVRTHFNAATRIRNAALTVKKIYAVNLIGKSMEKNRQSYL